MKNRERVLLFLDKQPVDRLVLMPITMMFAADQIGAKYSDYASDHRVLVEAQIRTASLFDIDYVSCISDPAREATDCGASVNFFDDQPPAIDETNALLSDKGRLAQLRAPDPLVGTRMLDRVRAAELFSQRIARERLVEGWIEGPCAEAADLRGINALMMDFFDDPSFVVDLFEFVLDMELSFAKAQVEAGVDIVGVGDAAASLVGPQIYGEYVWPFEKRLVEGLQKLGTRVRLHICGNISPILERIGELGCDIVDLDWMVSVADARQAMGPDQILLGNIDPVAVLLKGSASIVKEKLGQCRSEAGSNYVVGAGCEVPRGTPHENMLAMKDFASGY
jgi:MtaA/CmuA family methyltransferase